MCMVRQELCLSLYSVIPTATTQIPPPKGQDVTVTRILKATPPTPTPTPILMLPSTVQGVTVTRTVSPALKVSWSAVSGSNITYTVCYVNITTDPPHYAYTNCDASGITGTSTTLGPLSGGTTYKIWVRAVSSDGQGPYSYGGQYRTFQVKHIKTNVGLDAGSDASSVGLSAGLFIAGLFSGVIAVLLVEGIIWGAWKIRPTQKLVKLSEEGINNIQMTDCPAYVSNDREDKRADEYTYEEVDLGELINTKTE